MKRLTRLIPATRASVLISLLASASLAQGQTDDTPAPQAIEASEGEIRYVTDMVRRRLPHPQPRAAFGYCCDLLLNQ